ncbi:MAG: histidinol-phosphate transaminase [Gammaproteobacteria bacterium]|nr:histidinol-phosphate transaminase [Gammaproteobacteria bacterium]
MKQPLTSSVAAAARARAEQWIRPEIRALNAYHVPPAAGLIKLDAMENPYRWPQPVVDDWLEHLRGVSLNRYPDPSAQALKRELRAFFGVPPEMELLLGNGSDELIQIVALALAAPGRTALAAQPAFSMYRMISIFSGLEFTGVPLRAGDFGLEREAMLAAIARHRPALVLLDYPNNPTGGLFERDTVRAVIEAAPGIVVVDEAYQAFSEATLMDWLHDCPNLLVLRTLSKMGLAGLRLGMLAGRREWIEELDKIRLPYNINVLTQASAEFALRHRAMLEEQAGRIRADRESLSASLRGCRGLTVYPSRANFILFRAPAGRGGAIFAGLRERGVLIKNLDGAGEPLRDCLRVTVGTPEENQAFLTALTALL